MGFQVYSPDGRSAEAGIISFSERGREMGIKRMRILLLFPMSVNYVKRVRRWQLAIEVRELVERAGGENRVLTT